MPTHARWKMFAATTALACLSAFGCSGGDGLPREPVSGTVTVDDKPLKTGLISFVPAGADIATQAAANIIDGKYSISRASGLVPGKYKVSVSSGEGSEEKKTDTNEAPGMPPIPAKQLIPASFSSKTILEANIVEGQKTPLDFNIPLAAPKK